MTKSVKKPSPVKAAPVAETIHFAMSPQLAAVLCESRSAFFGGCVSATGE